MKKIALMALSLPLIWSCSKEDVPPALNIAPNYVEAESAGGSFDVAVSANIKWTAVSAADWVTVSPGSGSENGTIKITVKANPEFKDRETTVTLKGENMERAITVAQDGLSMQTVLSDSKWQLTDQLSGDSNYDDLKGSILTLNKDKSALLSLNLTLPDIGKIEKFEGTWAIAGSNLAISGELAGIPLVMLFEIKEPSEKVLKCQLKVASLLPPEGIPIILTRK